jgi:DNA-binding response OmpR family regulator
MADQSPASDTQPDATSATLLIVDDEEANRHLLALMLQSEGYTALTARGGQEALELLNRQPIDLVLLDIMMPEIDGYEVLRRMKADSSLRHIPVVVVSALDQTESIVRCIELGAEDYLTKPYKPLLLQARINSGLEKKRRHDIEVDYLAHIQHQQQRYEQLSQVVIPMGVAFSAEQDFNRMVDNILQQAKSLCNADAGTLYLLTPDNYLQLVCLRNDTLQIAQGGATGEPIPYPPLNLFDAATGSPNHYHVATHAALMGKSINLPDLYQVTDFDFSGTRSFDQQLGYTSHSFLTIPLKSTLKRVIGVLQLVNARDLVTGQIVPFDQDLQQMIESLSSMAAMACETYLREEQLRQEIQQLQANRSSAD